MTAGFWMGVAGLLALAWWMLLPAMRRPPVPLPASTAAGSNLRILKEQLSALDDELAQGRIDAAEHAHARAELQHRVLDEAGPPSTAAIGAHAGTVGRRVPLALAVGVPVVALALYGALGNMEGLQARVALDASAEPDIADVPIDAVVRMVDAMAERMRARPPGQASDAEGWTMLARSYAGLQRFSEAGDAYARASELAPNDAQLLADRADVLTMQQGRRTAGEPQRLIERALAIDPENLKALALAGSAAFERGDLTGAAGYWNRALGLAPQGSSFAQGLERSLAETRTAAREPPSPVTQVKGPAATARISGSVRLSPALAAQVAPTDTVFIVARAATGPRMPLAVMRRTAAELPIAFALDDGMAMSPEMKLSNFASVVVTARISRSGNATPQPGDLHGQSLPVGTRKTGLELTIDAVQP
jgi:cytochrome c-type biogenesis protein CcmH